MRSRVLELYDEYCTPKAGYIFKLWDTDVVELPAADSEQAKAETDSIDIYVHLVV